MADGKKVYSIEINGIKQSVDAVDSLNKQLDALEKRINELNSKGINVKSSSNVGSLKEEDALLKQIEKTQEKINDAKRQEYQQLLNAKAELKEYAEVAKGVFSAKNLESGINDTSTMQGMKAQLKDLKQAMQTVDVESDKFKKWQQEANEITQKLKDIEAGYGTFSRNVGNYSNGVADGLQKIVIKVGDTERTFTSAKEASRELNNELKAMALNGQQGTKEYDELNNAVKQMNSTIQDIGKSSVAMDNLLDTMQGMVAIMSTAKGISAFFGMDNDAIEQSIQKLVALQNVLNGIETIRKQMQTQEGIGMLLTKGNQAIDAMAASLLKVDKAAAGASKSVKVLSTALKAIGGAVVVAAVIAISAALDKLQKKFDEVKKSADQNAKYVEAGAEAYAKARLEVEKLNRKIDNFNGKTKEERKLVNEVNTTLGTHFKSLSDIRKNKDILIKQSELYCETLKQEAIAAATAAEYARLYAQIQGNLSKIRDLKGSMKEGFFNFGNFNIRREITSLEKETEQLNKQFETTSELLDTTTKKAADLRKKLGTGTEVKEVKSNGKNTEDAVKKAQDNINELKLRLMKDGLYKELKQLDEANRKEIEAIKKNGVKVEEQLLLQQQVYDKERNELFDKYIKSLEDANYTIGVNNAADSVQRLKEEWEKLYLVMNRPTSSKDSPLFGLQLENAGVAWKQYKKWNYLYDIRNDALSENKWEVYFDALKKEYLPKAAKEVQDEFFRLLGQTRPDSFDEWLEGDALITKKPNKEAFNYLRKQFEDQTSELKYLLTKYSGELQITEKGITQTLEDSFLQRESLTTNRYKKALEVTNQFIKDKLELELDGINKEEELERKAIEKRLESAKEGYQKLIKESKKYSGYTPESIGEFLRDKDKIPLNNGEYRDFTEEEKTLKNFVKSIDEYEKEATQLKQKYTNQRKRLESEALTEQQQNNAKYYEKEISNIEEFMQKASDILSNQPERTKLGFVNIKEAKKQYNEVLALYKHMSDALTVTVYEALKAANSGSINGEEFERIMNNVEFYKNKIKEETNEIKLNLKDLTVELLNDINFWIQQVGQAATSIIQSIGQINDAAFEKQMEALEKQTELLEKQLDKQKELTEQYADDVDSIEDELSTARGDRRQHLIDQLNAQMQAQRESLAQEKQIEKEQERLDAKKKKMEDDNNRRKKNQAITTAVINAALAISNAAVNHYPIPAIPMIAMATAVGAAQIAAVKAAKYAEGGIIQGKSHAQGGVKVLGGYAEVEGQEFITNKETTRQNADLLYYINSKKKRIDLADMIEFYSSAPKRTLQGMRTRFEDGGQLPTLRTDIEINNRLVQTMEEYAQRPTVVQVVDIINETEKVNRVQTLAGLKE